MYLNLMNLDTSLVDVHHWLKIVKKPADYFSDSLNLM